MCGILGTFQRVDVEGMGRRMGRGLQALAHRGPDAHDVRTFATASGVLRLGHARLSIIDLSSAGIQPMCSPDGRYVIVFNGEIYNYRELRTELATLGRRFYTDSDTEVLLAAWATWGRDCLTRLVGMFAFSVFDRQAATLTCVRDPFGIKPFFYVRDRGHFSFASELPALLEVLPSRPGLNWQRAYDYLVHGDYDSQTQSFVESVVHLPPAHVMVVDLQNLSDTELERWWSPQISERKDLSFEQAADQVRENFLQSIRLHLRSDVPLGAALSGGIDSSAVVCAMRHVAPDQPIHTFSYVAEGSPDNEEAWVDLVNRHVGAVGHKVTVSARELARDLDHMIRAQGEPFGSTSIYAQYRVYQLARDHGVTVTLDGQGADEMLAGYHGYPGQRMRSLLETGKWVQAFEFLSAWAGWPGRSRRNALQLTAAEIFDGRAYQWLRQLSGRQVMPPWLREGMLRDQGVVFLHPKQRPEVHVRGRRVVSELAHSLSQRGLVSLLRHGDRNSMRFSVESRVPFLTLEQVQLLLALPESFLVSPQGQTKAVFRKAMRGIVPDAVLDRRDKIGFQTPEKQWLVEMAPMVRQWLREDIGLPFFDQAAVRRAFDDMVSGRSAFSWQAWRWINFVRWHQIFLA